MTALCERADRVGLSVAFHMYEPVYPQAFEREYPEIMGVWKRPTQDGMVEVHSHPDPDNPAVWELVANKYAELARDFPLMRMVILTTWDGAGSYWCVPEAKMPIHRRLVRMIEAAREGIARVRNDVTVVFRLWGATGRGAATMPTTPPKVSTHAGAVFVVLEARCHSRGTAVIHGPS